MTALKRISNWLSGQIVNRVWGGNASSFIQHLAKLYGVNLRSCGEAQSGFNQFQDLDSSGEKHLVEEILRPVLSGAAIAFDIGAHHGNFSRLLADQYSSLRIHTFEPNPETYEVLRTELEEVNTISTHNLGMSSSVGTVDLHVSADSSASSHASICKDAQVSILGKDRLLAIPTKMTTVDAFCEEHSIKAIDFLKIDVEGNELEVIKGAQAMLANRAISAIQFEITQLNIETRIFLRDFRDLLPAHEFFRLTKDGLIPLGNWSPHQEVFLFQNILAIAPHVTTRISLPNNGELVAGRRAIASQIESNTGSPLRVVIGCGSHDYDGWVSTDYPAFDVTSLGQWQAFFQRSSIDNLLAEHVFEHLTEESVESALSNAYLYLKPGGRFRIAVPDGYHPDPGYIADIKPGGSGAGAYDHKQLITIDTFSKFAERTGFKLEAVEWWDCDGEFHNEQWDPIDGHVTRSLMHDRRNSDGRPVYTSLIVDLLKS